MWFLVVVVIALMSCMYIIGLERDRQVTLPSTDSPQALYARDEITTLELENEVQRQLKAGLDGEQPMATRGRRPATREEIYAEAGIKLDRDGLTPAQAAENAQVRQENKDKLQIQYDENPIDSQGRLLRVNYIYGRK